MLFPLHGTPFFSSSKRGNLPYPLLHLQPSVVPGGTNIILLPETNSAQFFPFWEHLVMASLRRSSSQKTMFEMHEVKYASKGNQFY